MKAAVGSSRSSRSSGFRSGCLKWDRAKRHLPDALNIGGKPPTKRRAKPLVSVSEGRHEKAPPKRG
jgi:hypothetical protein